MGLCSLFVTMDTFHEQKYPFFAPCAGSCMAHGEPSVSEEGTIGPSDHRTIGPSDHRTIGLAKKRIENLRDTMREWAPYHFS